MELKSSGSRRGFSLLEVSVVLVLIGLVAGIVLVADGMEQRQKQRSIIMDAETYSASIWRFDQKYGALPGDMPNATQVWGRADSPTTPDGADCGAPAINSATGRTCNGNGNGVIQIEGVSKSCEPYRMWEQLLLASMVTGNFSGVSGLANCSANSVADQNSPVASVKGATFAVTSYGEIGNGDPVFYPGNYNNILIFGGQRAGDFPVYPILTPAAAHEIDSKNDDGDPTRGKVRNTRSGAGTTPNCTRANIYDETASNPLCAVIFMSDFVKKTDQQ